jgi:hypothetical protein
LGFAFKKDTGDTRETPAIDVCSGLLADGAKLVIYDPQVKEDLIRRELSMAKFEWDHPGVANTYTTELVSSNVACASSIYDAAKDAHAICLITEWDEFKVDTRPPHPTPRLPPDQIMSLSPFEGCMRDVKEVHATCVDSFLLPSFVKRGRRVGRTRAK